MKDSILFFRTFMGNRLATLLIILGGVSSGAHVTRLYTKSSYATGFIASEISTNASILIIPV